MRSIRFGVTRPEVLVLLAFGALLAGFAFPAIAKVRALSNREQCANNLKQIGQASLKYAESNNGQLPNAGGYILQILPYSEHSKITDAIAKSGKSANDPVNAELVATHIAMAQCPDVPKPDRLIGGRAPTDYTGCPTITVAIRDIFPANYDLSTALGGVGAAGGGGRGRLNEITDGVSTTFLGVVESGDRPNQWQDGKQMPGNVQGGGGTWVANGIWAPRGYTWDGKSFPGPCAMNCNNFAAVYSFHKEGCNFVFADGSVRFLKKEIDIWVFYAGLTRRGGELLTGSDF